MTRVDQPRRRYTLRVLTSIALVTALVWAEVPRPLDAPRGYWSRDAVCVWEFAGKRLEIPSPDGKKVIVVESRDGVDDPLRVVHVVANGKRYDTDIGYDVGAELAWSPDSMAFSETFSNGGAVGTFQLRLFYIERSRLRVVEPTDMVERDFLAHYPKCFDLESPNIGVIAWLGSSSRLLVAAEVLPHSNCDSMGTFAAYEIDLPSGRIARKHNQIEAKRRFWQQLGDELRNAEDACVLDPKSCWIPQLHPGTSKK